MKLLLKYGKGELNIEVPDNSTVLLPSDTPVLENTITEITRSLRNPINTEPLAGQIRPGDRVVISHSDITRASPRKIVLPVILSELAEAGVRDQDIYIVNALGTHRKQTYSELVEMLGRQVVDRYRCIQHDAFNDQELIYIGNTRFGHPVRLNRCLMEADFKILTGFIEPHFFAGFSGGPKAVLPALAGAESVFTNHGYDMIANPNANWGITEGNPIWEEMMEVSQYVKPSFLVDVSLNRKKEINGLFAGELLAAHAAGRQFVAENSMKAVDGLFDIVIATNGGYPLDQNLYQCVKGMSTAKRIVREGGAILMVVECKDGLPEHGMYKNLLKECGSPQAILKMISSPGFSCQDQWQVQIQALIQIYADVYIHSEYLSEAQIQDALFFPCQNLDKGVTDLIQKYGGNICVLPDGPHVIPYLKQ
jgi:lactate racemase